MQDNSREVDLFIARVLNSRNPWTVPGPPEMSEARRNRWSGEWLDWRTEFSVAVARLNGPWPDTDDARADKRALAARAERLDRLLDAGQRGTSSRTSGESLFAGPMWGHGVSDDALEGFFDGPEVYVDFYTSARRARRSTGR